MDSYLSVVVRDRQDATVLAVSGELDLASSPHLWQALDRLDPTAPGRTILDLAELQFIDVTGLRVLLRARERVLMAGGNLTLINVGGGVRRLLKLTGSTELLDMIE